MDKHGRNVNTIRTRHAIFAVIARHRRIFQHQLCRFFQKLLIILGQRNQRGVCTDIILQMLHIRHTTQHRQHQFRGTGKAKCPRCHTIFRATLFKTRHDMSGHIREASSQQRFHNDRRNIALHQFIIQIIRIHIASRSMFPIHIIKLYLYKIPFHFIVQGECIIICVYRTVKRESQIADTPRLPLFQQKFHHSVINIPCLESLRSATTDGVEQIVIDIIRLQILERLAIHGNGILTAIITEIREFGSNEQFLTRMTFQRNAC